MKFYENMIRRGEVLSWTVTAIVININRDGTISYYTRGLYPNHSILCVELQLELGTWCRVPPTQIAFSKSLCFSCLTVNFPCANLRDLWLLYTQNCLIQLLWKNGNFRGKYQNIFTFRIREFTTWTNQIPCVLAKFPNSLCFPWQGFFVAVFPVFPVAWVPCWWHNMYQVHDKFLIKIMNVVCLIEGNKRDVLRKDCNWFLYLPWHFTQKRYTISTGKQGVVWPHRPMMLR